MSIIEKIDNEKDLEKVAGGYEAIFGATNTLKVSKKEYEKLEKEGYIVDGKIHHGGDKGVSAAASFLEKEGFKGTRNHLCFMYLGYKPPEYGRLIVTDDDVNK